MPTTPFVARALAGLLLGTLIPPLLNAQPAPRPRIGIALGSGGVAGLAHVGVLKWLYAHHIPIDAIAGTSMGALVGGIYASGKTPEQLEQISEEVNLRKLFATRTDFEQLNVRRRQDRLQLPGAIKVGLRRGVHLESSLARSTSLEALLDSVFLPFGEHADFDRLPIPFRCVSTDLTSAESVVFERGSLPMAIRASTAIPGVYPPVASNGHALVDGALLKSLPVDVVRGMQADVVIAVRIPAQVDSSANASLLGVLARSISVVSLANERQSRTQADVVLEPQTQAIETGTENAVERLIQAGWNAAESQSEKLLSLRISDSEWTSYLQQIAQRSPSPPPPPQFAEARGGNAHVRAATLKAVEGSLDQPVDTSRIEQELDQVRASDRWQAGYAAGRSGNTAGLLIHLNDSTTGPPFLLIGGDVVAQSSDVTRTSFQQHFVWQDVGSYGSEFRFNSRLGFQTDLSAEYYFKLGLTKFFLAPRATLNRDPTYIYQDQKRTAERFDRREGGGFDAGYAINNESELRAGWSAQNIRWTPRLGDDGQGVSAGPVHDFSVRYSWFGQDHAMIATSGAVLHADAGYLLPGPLEDGTPHAAVHAAKFLRLDPNNSLVFAFTGGTYFGNPVSDALRFALGGPYQLSSAVTDEFRGDSFALIQPAFLHKIAQLPAPLGQRLFAAVAYEAGKVWNLGEPSVLRQDALLGLLAETPLGPMGFGLSLGDAGHRKVFFSLGRAFGQ